MSDTTNNKLREQVEILLFQTNGDFNVDDFAPAFMHLIETACREARIDEVECLQIYHNDENNDYGEQQVIDTSMYLDERIAELQSQEENHEPR